MKREKLYAWFKDNMWVADLAEMGSLAFSNCGIKHLFCGVKIFTKYVWFNV